MRQGELYDSIKVCEHDSDYSVLYDFVGMRHVMCNSCWHEEEHVRTGRDTVSILWKWQLRAVKRGVPSLRHGRYGADGMYRMFFRRARQSGYCTE